MEDDEDNLHHDNCRHLAACSGDPDPGPAGPAAAASVGASLNLSRVTGGHRCKQSGRWR